MRRIRTIDELATPDKRTLLHTPLGLSMGGMMKPDAANEFQQGSVADADLDPKVPESLQHSFERLRTIHSLGIFCYEAFTVAHDLAWLVLEQAFRERLISYYEGSIKFWHADGSEETINAHTFDEASKMVKDRRLMSRGWNMRLLASKREIKFPRNLSELQKWARLEDLLKGQRNRQLESVYTGMRNLVAHPDYHVLGPHNSARTIRDIAEIINRLWGRSTPGGRLYPDPLPREIFVLGSSHDGSGQEKEQVRAGQFINDDVPLDWTYLVLRAVDRGELWEFDPNYERTRYPCELLWGPCSGVEARDWLRTHSPVGDTVNYLDRQFAIQIHDGQVVLPRRLDVALSLSPGQREGIWHVVRADFPNDALAYVRQLQAGGVPSKADAFRDFGVEDEYQGDWKGLFNKFSADS